MHDILWHGDWETQSSNLGLTGLAIAQGLKKVCDVSISGSIIFLIHERLVSSTSSSSENLSTCSVQETGTLDYMCVNWLASVSLLMPLC